MTTTNPVGTAAPSVAAIIPCRNEAPFIRSMIRSLLSSTYPLDRLEVIFVDGMSTDGTRAVLEAAARDHAFIRVLDNPLMTAPVAMNLGIRAARAEIVVRLDAHNEYAPDYISRCVLLLVQSGPRTGSVGGHVVPVADPEKPWSAAVALVTSHRFGVGGSFRTASRPGLVDTVPCGTFYRRVLEEVGLYDARLTRNQDSELSARLRKAGYNIVYDPRIRIYYHNQSRLGGLVRQAYFTGVWNVYALVLHPHSGAPRRFVPMCFVGYIAGLAFASAIHARGAQLAALPLGLYALLVAIFSLGSGETAGRLRVAATFVSYHLSYGVGGFFGIANVLTGRWRGHLGRPLPRRRSFDGSVLQSFIYFGQKIDA